MEKRRKSVIDCSKDPSRTKQYFKGETDINTIVERINSNGQIPVRSGAFFADVTGSQMDYAAALQFVRTANEKFWQLDPSLRMRFKNDVGQLLSFIDNPANKAECIELGLLPAEKKPVQSVPPEQVQQEREEPQKEALSA